MTTWKNVRHPLNNLGTLTLRALPQSWRVRTALSLGLVSITTVLLLGLFLLNRDSSVKTPVVSNSIVSSPINDAANLSIQDLLPVLTRSGKASNNVDVDVTYAPPVFFQVTGQEPPKENDIVFFLQETIHKGEFLASSPSVYLTVDGVGRYLPSEAKVLTDDVHHRISRLVFNQKDMPETKKSLSMVIPREDGILASSNSLTWELPIQLPNGSTSGTQLTSSAAVETQDSALSSIQLSSMTKALRKVQKNVAYGGAREVEVAATFATPDYFQAALTSEAANRYAPDKFAVFIVSETAHVGNVSVEVPSLLLRYEGRTYQPDLIEQKVSSPHHRVEMVRFPVNPNQSKFFGTMELQLPDGSSLSWRLPIVYQGARGTSPLGFTVASLLALLGGLIAAMWPCLFQLTVFFIPTMAGLTMEEASGKVGMGQRFRVIKAAIFFVLGFTLVYTVGGAFIGFAVQRLGSAPNFELWQRYIGIFGGIAIIILALRTAAKVRAPLVCKMPVLSNMAHSGKAANPLELMFAGLAFATGCMTCFGAALIITMVVYVGMSGSAAFGAVTLFLFSLGMGIPLVIAATAMAKVLPTLFRLEKIIPWMGLASSLIMVGFAILLITGNYMALTTWIYKTLPVGIGQ